MIENIVAKIGAAKLIVIASAIGKNFKPKYKNVIANAPPNALTKCNFIFSVLSKFPNLSFGIIKSMGIKPKNPLKKMSCPVG
jgi:hypothetical protein